MEVIYRTLELNECNRISEINASQYIGRAWRNVDGSRRLVEINYQETDFPNGFAIGCEETKEINQKLYQLEFDFT